MIINEYCNELLKEILKKNKKKNTKLIIDFINNIDKDHLQAIQYSKYCGIKYIIELIEKVKQYLNEWKETTHAQRPLFAF